MPGRALSCVARTSGSLLILSGLSGAGSGVLAAPRSCCFSPTHSLTKCCGKHRRPSAAAPLGRRGGRGRPTYLFSLEVLAAPGADSVRGGRAAVGGAGFWEVGGDGLRLRGSERFPFGGFVAGRLGRLDRRSGGQVRTSADGASPPALLADVRAVPGETLPVSGGFDLGRFQPRLLFDLQNWLEGADAYLTFKAPGSLGVRTGEQLSHLHDSRRVCGVWRGEGLLLDVTAGADL